MEIRNRIIAIAALHIFVGACSGVEKPETEDSDLDTETSLPVEDVEDTEDTSSETPPVGDLTVVIEDPTDYIEYGDQAFVSGWVSDIVYGPSDLTVTWFSSIDGLLATVIPDNSGLVHLSTETLSPGWHQLTLEASNPSGLNESDDAGLGICVWESPETFDTDIAGAGWRIYGDAYWDAQGWLEMTGNQPSRQGAIYLIDQTIQPGSADISFKINTGGGINGGADGFAVSIFNVDTVEELEEVVNAGMNGGCLAYGVTGPCGDIEVDAFHIEFDTWYNGPYQDDSGMVHPWDPTQQNHVGICLDGDPGSHYLWAAIPTIEDLQWHQVTVEIDGNYVHVTIDGVPVMSNTVPGLRFKGGYLGFSGTTGWASNYHRFDDLNILAECLVPSE